MNILNDDLINHIWRMIYGKNRVNNEIDNIDCDIDKDVKRYATKYVNIVNDKLVLIYAVSESIDELMEGLDVDTSNDIAAKIIKDFKRVIIKSTDKFNSYIKLNIKKKDIQKRDIEKKISKKKISKRKISKRKILKRKVLKRKILKRKIP